MKIDLHNHTVLCNHAEGTVDEYIQRAIKLGITIYGFSEHAPMDFDEGYRLGFDEMASYRQEILDAKVRYKDQIDIRVGYEVDWLPGHMDERVLNAEVDFLIGSVHFINKWGFDNPAFIGGWKDKEVDDIWQLYFEAMTAMAESGKFDIVGHFDLIKVFGYLPRGNIQRLAYKALQAIKASDMALEINSAGLRKPIGQLYPSISLLREAYALDIPITFGSDAHSPPQVGAGLEEAYTMAISVGYKQAVTFKKREKEMVNF